MKPADRDVQHYDAMTIVMHWLTALMVLVLWIGAKTLDWFPRGALRAEARSLHITVGLLLGALVAGRIVWRLSFGRPLPPVDAGAMGLAAKLTHRGLYALMAVMICVGVMLFALTGDTMFNSFEMGKLSPTDQALADQLKGLHDIIGWIILAVAGTHSGAVLYHQHVMRDGVLARILPRRRAG